MATFRLSVDVDASDFHEAGRRLADLPARIEAAMIRATERGTEVLFEEYHDLINKDTGRTASTIGMSIEGMTGYVGSDDEVAGYLEYGTSAHVIEPSSKRALFGPGFAHPVDHVLHPGTPEYAPLLRAGLASMFEIEQIYVDEIEDVWGSI